jgi:hypothetical protein
MTMHAQGLPAGELLDTLEPVAYDGQARIDGDKNMENRNL